MNGKTKTPAEGGQQEETRPLEGSTQNQLKQRLDVKMVRRFKAWMMNRLI